MANMLSAILKDVTTHARKSSLSDVIQTILFGRGLHMLLLYRLQRALLRLPIFGLVLAKIVWYVSSVLTGCEISYRARIAPGVYFPHPVGIVIGAAYIEEGVTVLQGVTIGKKGVGNESEVRLLGGAFIGAGAKILGDVTIGRDSVVGANAVVVKDVPDGATALGVPAVVTLKVG